MIHKTNLHKAFTDLFGSTIYGTQELNKMLRGEPANFAFKVDLGDAGPCTRAVDSINFMKVADSFSNDVEAASLIETSFVVGGKSYTSFQDAFEAAQKQMAAEKAKKEADKAQKEIDATFQQALTDLANLGLSIQNPSDKGVILAMIQAGYHKSAK